MYPSAHLVRLLSDTEHSLVKVGEEVHPKRMLFVKFVSIRVLYRLQGLAGAAILQEDVPAGDVGLFNRLRPTTKQVTQRMEQIPYPLVRPSASG